MWLKTEKLKFIFVFGWILLFIIHHYTDKGRIWLQGPVIMPCLLRADMEVYGRIWYQEVWFVSESSMLFHSFALWYN
jgi:hypothetical protein